MKPRKIMKPPEPKDRFAEWVVAGLVFCLTILIIYVDHYGRTPPP